MTDWKRARMMVMLGVLKESMEKHPDMRLGQLIVNASYIATRAERGTLTVQDIFGMENSDLAGALLQMMEVTT